MIDLNTLMALQALGDMGSTPGLGAMPGMAQQVAQPGGPMVAGPQTAQPQAGKPFPINASILAALGAGAAGLQAGRPGPAPMAGAPSVAARAPGGFNPVYNRLPGRG